MANRKPLEESETTMTRNPSHLERAAELLRSILDPVDGQATPRATPEQKAWLEADRESDEVLSKVETTGKALDEHRAYGTCEFCGEPRRNRQQDVCGNIYLCRDRVMKRATEAEARLNSVRTWLACRGTGDESATVGSLARMLLSAPTAESGKDSNDATTLAEDAARVSGPARLEAVRPEGSGRAADARDGAKVVPAQDGKVEPAEMSAGAVEATAGVAQPRGHLVQVRRPDGSWGIGRMKPAPVAEAPLCSTCGGRGTIDEPGAQSGPTSPCPDCAAQRPRAPVAEAPERVTHDGQRGLYRKYAVTRLNDPAGKHAGCEYFVLDLKHDKFAPVALVAYARVCEDEYPVLSRGLSARFGADADKLEESHRAKFPALANVWAENKQLRTQQEAAEREACATKRLFSDALRLVAEGDERERALQTEAGELRKELGDHKERLTELEQRLARVAELAHDRDGDSLQYRSDRLGKCAQVSWDHMEESFSKDPLKKRSTLKWAHLAAQVTAAEEERDSLKAKLSEAERKLAEVERELRTTCEAAREYAGWRDARNLTALLEGIIAAEKIVGRAQEPTGGEPADLESGRDDDGVRLDEKDDDEERDPVNGQLVSARIGGEPAKPPATEQNPPASEKCPAMRQLEYLWWYGDSGNGFSISKGNDCFHFERARGGGLLMTRRDLAEPAKPPAPASQPHHARLTRKCHCLDCDRNCSCGRERTSVHEAPCPLSEPCVPVQPKPADLTPTSTEGASPFVTRAETISEPTRWLKSFDEHLRSKRPDEPGRDDAVDNALWCLLGYLKDLETRLERKDDR